MKIVVMIPTYNEKDNIEILCESLLALDLDLEILVVDDNSPDGTSSVVKRIADKTSRVSCLVRMIQRGRGLAGIEGFKKALEKGADYVVEMDGDLSHNPKYIPKFIQILEEKNCDVILGSRFIHQGRDEQRSILRKLISACARQYLRIVLGIKAQDPTTGYRMFKRNVLEKILPNLKAVDPFIVTEVLYYCYKNKFNICEVPISFEERKKGESKLGSKVLLKYLIKVWKLKYASFICHSRPRVKPEDKLRRESLRKKPLYK